MPLRRPSSAPARPKLTETLTRLSLLALIAALYIARGASGLKANEALGLVAEKPASGRFVQTDRGYMVPYTVAIPGTKIQFEMVPVPGGTAKIGSPAGEAERHADEGPEHEVTFQPFWIGKYEVTWAEYRHFMQMYDLFKNFETQSVRQVTADNRVDAVTIPTPLYDPSFTFVLGEQPRQPAVTMSHFAARQYTKWLSLISGQIYRLPSEAEWEYAARAGSTTAYSFGDDATQLDEYAWYYDNSDESYHDVGGKQPNAWGIHDLHGNVAEFVLDHYRAEAYAELAGKTVTSEQATQWAAEPFPHVIRGGSWSDDPATLRSAARAQTEDWRNEDPNLPRSPWWFTDEPALAVGFRIVRPLDKPAADLLKKYWDADSEILRQAVEDRIAEGRGVLGLVDPQLPKAAEN